MTRWRRSPADAFWFVDRIMGGQQPPTRFMKWAARRPVVAGLCAAAPFSLFLLFIGDDVDFGDVLFAVLFGLVMALCFGLTAMGERLRQKRLRRLGLWDGS